MTVTDCVWTAESNVRSKCHSCLQNADKIARKSIIFNCSPGATSKASSSQGRRPCFAMRVSRPRWRRGNLIG